MHRTTQVHFPRRSRGKGKRQGKLRSMLGESVQWILCSEFHFSSTPAASRVVPSSTPSAVPPPAPPLLQSAFLWSPFESADGQSLLSFLCPPVFVVLRADRHDSRVLRLRHCPTQLMVPPVLAVDHYQLVVREGG